ncbi:MAG TPA: PilN domain-containing protein [Gemmatimonadota bacterium]
MKRSLGIEVGRGFVAACEVTAAGDGTVRGQRSGRHVLETDAPTPEDLADACLRVALEAGIRERAAVLALARELTWAKPVTLPPVSEEDRLRLLRVQPERFFPVPDRPLVCDLEPASNGAPPMAHAAEVERLESILDALASRGFRVRAVLPGTAALARAVTSAAPDAASGDWLLVRPEGADLGAHAFRAGTLRASRRVPDFAGDPAGAALEVARTARRSFDDAGGPDQVRWSGWLQLPASVRQAAGEALGVAVRDLPELPVGSDGIAAYGAAVAGLEAAPRPDLLPDSVRERRRQQSRWITVACAVLAATGLVALLWALGERNERQLGRLDEAIARATRGAEAAAAARDEVVALEDRITALENAMRDRAVWLRTVADVSGALPGRAWLGTLALEEGGTVSLSGYAATASALIPALEASESLTNVELAAPATRATVAGRELEAFNIRGAIEGTAADSAAGAEAADGGAAP